VFGAAGWVARRPVLDDREAQAFNAVNALPDSLHPPVWVLMQAGSLGGALALSLLGGRLLGRRTGVTMAAAGTAVWAGAKVVKHGFKRARPAGHIDDLNIRGPEASGLGFPSGHAAVAMTLATVAAPSLSPLVRTMTYTAATKVGLARVYVGAHLPADIIGGAGLGYAIGTIATAIEDAISGD
jgi:undecaprenyl-diphosphatase